MSSQENCGASCGPGACHIQWSNVEADSGAAAAAGMNDADVAATFDADDYFYFYGPWADERHRTEADQIWRLLQLAEGDSVPDAPCGHGRLANTLASRGCRMTGVDITPPFIARARKDAADTRVSVDYRIGDIRALDLPSDAFDAAFSWFTSFGYFSDAENRRVLEEYRRVLRPGGALLIETLQLASILRRMRGTVATRRGDDVMLDETAYVVETSRLETDRLHTRRAGTRQPFRSPPLELRMLLSDVGFSSVRFTDRDGEALDVDTRRQVALAR